MKRHQIALVSFLAALVLISFGANAETAKVVRKTTTTITTVETEGATDDEATPAPTSETITDDELTNVFGPTATTGMTGCKTEELAKSAVRELKSDCGAWLKDQKSQLRDRYVTGTCEEQCSDCQMHLRRCAVKGMVRYSKASQKK